MSVSSMGCDPSRIPEYRIPEMRGFERDFSREDGLLSPHEPELRARDSMPTDRAESDLPLASADGALLRALSVILPEGGRALLFEPTRPDIRLAILQRGASYIDGGRLLDGRPDPAVLKGIQGNHVDLMIFEADDVIPKGVTVPVLVDTRAFPYGGRDSSANYKLCAPGPRDGYPENLGIWVEGPKGEPIDSGAVEEGPRIFSGARRAPGFAERSRERSAHLEQSLRSLHGFALDAGFEGIQRAGYLWLGLPGFTCEQIQRAFQLVGVGVFACTHHPYRHRVRLTPPDLNTTASLSLIFSRAYKNLTT